MTSDWFRVQTLLYGLDQCSGISQNQWARLMIRFTVSIRGKSEEDLTGETSWLQLKFERGGLFLLK